MSVTGEFTGFAHIVGEEARARIFREIYDKYFKLVWFCAFRFLGNKEDTDEVSDDVFVNFYRRAERTEISNVKYYLTRSARNLSLNRLRDRKNTEELDENRAGEYFFCEGSDLLEKIAAVTSKEEFDLLCRHVLEGYTLSEIAVKLGESVNTVKSKYRRLVKRLKSELEDFCDE